jgi:hypothetical protein
LRRDRRNTALSHPGRSFYGVEATPGIEPGYTVLQTVA